MNESRILASAVAGACLLLGATAALAAPIAYHGLVVTDVRIEGKLHHFATVQIDVLADTRDVHPLTNGDVGYRNDRGDATITVDLGSEKVVAHVKPHQIYTQLDLSAVSVGFGSIGKAGAYPLVLSTATGPSGGNTAIEAIADLAVAPADAANYSPATPTLLTDLTTATALSGAALSCSKFDGLASTCSDLTPVTLATDEGPISLYSPYTDAGDGTAPPTSLNWGLFWIDR